jgi:hypothetical protein
LPTSTSSRYVAIISRRIPRKAAGSGRNANVWATGGMNGRSTPRPAQLTVATKSGRLGRLRVNGTRLVRITKITSDWVASDSTNQPVWNRCAPAWKTHSITPNVRKS